jgi:hypothetical protein
VKSNWNLLVRRWLGWAFSRSGAFSRRCRWSGYFVVVVVGQFRGTVGKKCASPYFHFFIFSSLVFIVIVIVSYRHTMPLATRITKMLNIEHPVVMGGMTGTGTPELAAAVSNAGGLGLFAVLNAGTPEKCRAWIKLMPTLTDKPW